MWFSFSCFTCFFIVKLVLFKVSYIKKERCYLKKRMLKGAVSIILSAVLALGTIATYAAESEDKNKNKSWKQDKPYFWFFWRVRYKSGVHRVAGKRKSGSCPKYAGLFLSFWKLHKIFFKTELFCSPGTAGKIWFKRYRKGFSRIQSGIAVSLLGCVCKFSSWKLIVRPISSHKFFISPYSMVFIQRRWGRRVLQNQRPVYAGRFKRICSGHNGCMERPNF